MTLPADFTSSTYRQEFVSNPAFITNGAAATATNPIAYNALTGEVTAAAASATAVGIVTAGAQTLAGVKTFSAAPLCTAALTPSDSTALVAKGYCDQLVKGLSWQQEVIDFRDMDATPPVAPAAGDRYVATATAGLYTADNIYEWDAVAAGWIEIPPDEGYAVYVTSDTSAVFANQTAVFNANDWVSLGSTVTYAALVGVPDQDAGALNKAGAPTFGSATITNALGAGSANITNDLHVYGNLIVDGTGAGGLTPAVVPAAEAAAITFGASWSTSTDAEIGHEKEPVAQTDAAIVSGYLHMNSVDGFMRYDRENIDSVEQYAVRFRWSPPFSGLSLNSYAIYSEEVTLGAPNGPLYFAFNSGGLPTLTCGTIFTAAAANVISVTAGQFYTFEINLDLRNGEHSRVFMDGALIIDGTATGARDAAPETFQFGQTADALGYMAGGSFSDCEIFDAVQHTAAYLNYYYSLGAIEAPAPFLAPALVVDGAQFGVVRELVATAACDHFYATPDVREYMLFGNTPPYLQLPVATAYPSGSRFIVHNCATGYAGNVLDSAGAGIANFPAPYTATCIWSKYATAWKVFIA